MKKTVRGDPDSTRKVAIMKTWLAAALVLLGPTPASAGLVGTVDNFNQAQDPQAATLPPGAPFSITQTDVVVG